MPIPSGTNLFRRNSSIAQSVEHAAVNRSVVGSSPTGGVSFSDLEPIAIELAPWSSG